MLQTYYFTGYYFQNNQRGNLEGTIIFDSSDNIAGTIIDKINPSSNRMITGKRYTKNDEINLDFLVKVPEENLLNLHYSLTKQQINNLEGAYLGSYQPVKKLISFTVTDRSFTPFW